MNSIKSAPNVNSDYTSQLHVLLNYRMFMFDSIVKEFLSDTVNTDDSFNAFSNLVLGISLEQFGQRKRLFNHIIKRSHKV